MIILRKLVVTDPCYFLSKEQGTPPCLEDASLVFHNPRKGKWKGRAEREKFSCWGVRNKEIVVHHEEYSPNDDNFHLVNDLYKEGKINKDDISFTGNPGYQPVDAGLMMFSDKVVNITYDGFIDDLFKNMKDGIAEDLTWICGDSGFGDGLYNTYAIIDDGEVVAVKVLFIGDDDEEYDEDDYLQSSDEEDEDYDEDYD